MSQILPAVQFGQLKTDKPLRLEICKVGRWMYRRGLVVSCQGNLSIRIDEDRILLTPAGACKGRLAPQDLLITDLKGKVLSGSGEPSTETQMHLLYYRARPDVNAVCHAHPPTATGFAAAGRSLEAAVLPEIVVSLGKIPLAPYGTPGTWELCAGLESLVPQHDAILLENHGVVTCGKDLITAYDHMETVEQFARIMQTAEVLGGPHLLSRVEIQKLIAARPRYRVARPRVSVEFPLSADASQMHITRSRSDNKPLIAKRAQPSRFARPRSQA